MKKIIILLIMIVAVAGVIGVSAFKKDADGVVGYLDGQAVGTAELQNYVETLLGENYRKKLTTEEGRKELFGHYVNRTLLLEYAKQNIKEEDSFVTSHTMGNVSPESAMLSAVLKKEINDKVEYTEQEVKDLLKSDPRFKNVEGAEREIISQKRLKLFDEFMNKVKSGHKVELADS